MSLKVKASSKFVVVKRELSDFIKRYDPILLLQEFTEKIKEGHYNSTQAHKNGGEI
jgi:hypothetical protein